MAKALMRKDLSGQRFGKLTVDCIDEKRTGNGKVYWWCDCDCGGRKSIQSTALTRKKNGTKSCGCARNSKDAKIKARYTHEKYPEDITGFIFGRLTVVRKTNMKSARVSDNGAYLWECECECGKLCYYSRYSLITPNGIRSCGCLYKDSRHEANKRYNTYDLETYGYGVGYCNNGTHFLFDKEDYDKIKNYCWWYDGRYVLAHTLDDDGYTTANIRMHRVVLDIGDREEINVDHRNLIRYDCRKSNLRKATDCENARNKKECFATLDNPVGIFKTHNQKFIVSIMKQNKEIFDSFEDAFNYRKQMEKELYGEFQYNPYEQVVTL